MTAQVIQNHIAATSINQFNTNLNRDKRIFRHIRQKKRRNTLQTVAEMVTIFKNGYQIVRKYTVSKRGLALSLQH